ncbi:MAG: beta-ketoacyl synthase N-terminal-like domain-containing protein [Vicinamibacterales bacterium]
MRRDVLSMVGLGATTPVGRDAWSSAAAVRAAVTGFTEHPYMVDTAGQPMRVALAPWLDIDSDPLERFEALLLPALEQALEPLKAAAGASVRVALALGLPASRPGLPAQLEQNLRAFVLTRLPNRFAAVATFAVGHAGALLGLHAAAKKIAEGAFDACVVAGVESYMTPETLEWLEEQEQLHGAGRLNNAWGFVPGEAAGAVLLAGAEAVSRIGFEELAWVLSVGRGLEKNLIKTESVCLGEGLTGAFREALLGLPHGGQVADVYCDMNGEPYRGDEFGFAALRTGQAFVSASNFVAPADCWGDVSAASVPLGLMQAAIAARKAYATGPYALVWASSESGERGAVLLELPELQRPPR